MMKPHYGKRLSLFKIMSLEYSFRNGITKSKPSFFFFYTYCFVLIIKLTAYLENLRKQKKVLRKLRGIVISLFRNKLQILLYFSQEPLF